MEERILELFYIVKNLTENSKEYYANVTYSPRYNKVKIEIINKTSFDTVEEIAISFNAKELQYFDNVIEHIKDFGEMEDEQDGNNESKVNKG